MDFPKASDFITNIAFDSVVFGFSGQELKILIMEYHNTGYFALPGGFVRRDEALNDAVQRGLHERTGLKDVFLEQFYTFGGLSRFQPEIMARITKENEMELPPDHWMLDRFISVGYYALIDYNQVELKPDALSDSIKWYNIDELPELILDHQEIVQKALQTLKGKLYTQVVGKNLLPEKFTMKDLQNVYEAILGEKLRRTSFQRKILSLELLNRHEKLYNGKAHKAPYLYSYK